MGMQPYGAIAAVVISTAFSLTVLGGCTTERPAPIAPPTALLEPPPPQELDDADIADAVGRALAHDPAIGDAPVQIFVGNGIVGILGEVPNLQARERITERAEAVRGVRAVSNRMSVPPSDKSDETIEDDVRQALLLDPVAELFEVRPSVQGGVVRLDGFTQSWVEKRIANDVARDVAGVREVDDHIAVVPMERPDEAIEDDVRGALRWDAEVRDDQIDVAVEDGVVELSGYVGSAAEKSRALDLAHVQGVRRVDAGGLDVRWWAPSAELRAPETSSVTDLEIQNALIEVIQRDPRVRNFPVQVRVEDGHVTLDGIVDNLRAARALEELAESTVGVREVDNTIQVRPTAAVEDKELRELVELALILNPVTSEDDIDVEVDYGRVTLTGVADDRYEKAEAENVAMGIRGTTAIDNQLAVEPRQQRVSLAPREVPEGPQVTPITILLPDDSEGEAELDSEIESAIEEELLWNARLSAYEVDVEVDDGHAILTGTVENIMDLRVAETIALAAGATSVENRLRMFDSVLDELD